MPKPILKNEFKISKDALSDLHDFQNSFGEEELIINQNQKLLSKTNEIKIHYSFQSCRDCS